MYQNAYYEKKVVSFIVGMIKKVILQRSTETMLM